MDFSALTLVYVLFIYVLQHFFIVSCFFFFKQKTAYEMRISDWSSDVCSSDLHDDDRDDPREDGPVDEETCHGSLRYSCATGAGVVVVLAVAAVSAASSSCAAASVAGAGVASGRGAAAFSATSTLAPGAIFCRPSTTTRSPAARPDSTSHWSPMVWLTTTGRCSTTPSALTTIAVVLPFGSRAMPCIGARIASCRMPASSTARTYMPGIRMWSGLSTRIRRLKLPVLGSTLTSENSSVPLCENSLPSSSRIVTGVGPLRSRLPAASSRRRRSSSLLDWVTST